MVEEHNAESENTDTVTEFPTQDGFSWLDIVKRLETGDIAHLQLPSDGDDPFWGTYSVIDAGETYADLGSTIDQDRAEYRVEESTDPDDVQRSLGDGGVKLFERVDDELFNTDLTPSLKSIERVPAGELVGEDWYAWEVIVSEVPGNDVSTGTTVFPDAPTRSIAKAKAKRWAELENGYIVDAIRDLELPIPSVKDT